MNLLQVLSAMTQRGAVNFYAKELATNDCSKNQIYVAGTTSVFSILPPQSVHEHRMVSGEPAFLAPIHLSWMDDDATFHRAAHAQLIYYPKYPEIRIGSLIRGCSAAPRDILVTRQKGRFIVFGVMRDGQILAYACTASHPLAADIRLRIGSGSQGVFIELGDTVESADYWRAELLQQLCSIAHAGWMPGQRLTGSGRIVPCNSSNCGGYTLECALGVRPNGFAKPDYHGWEVKSYTVRSLSRPAGQVVTLMTPEPDGGLYQDQGPEVFVRTYGYEDLCGRHDRLNFGGRFAAGSREARTRLRLQVIGYDDASRAITDPGGSIALLDDADNVASSWSFSGLLNHWRRKHANAVYVPVECKTGATRLYSFGQTVSLAEGADFVTLLAAFSASAVYYDPGIKLEGVSTAQPTLKRRSQFRIRFKSLPSLYTHWTPVDACSP